MTLAEGFARMQLKTTRFGLVDIQPEDVIHFPAGLIGLEHCRQWVLLADTANDALAWMQCVSDAEIALAVVSPGRFVPGYQVRVYRGELAPLQLSSVRNAQVLAVVGKNDAALTLNLKAPLVINLERRAGRQVIVNSDEPTQFELQTSGPTYLRRSA
jgi:flagellar assembly factor FliW